eukprot:TRINITY_DN50431_c0_g1_i1.p2 TRINITY_DN50431_c0_g1~~TRINITY_DN50431_c0_g1_i1.p2  ORF type:complete len:147 (+),score=39.42 TRINITY_DN50431_c0_g1_i1:54-494(+)
MQFVLFFFFKQKTAYEMLRSLVGSEMCIRDSSATSLTVLQLELPQRVSAAGGDGLRLAVDLLPDPCRCGCTLAAPWWFRRPAELELLGGLLGSTAGQNKDRWGGGLERAGRPRACLLYTSDAADEEDSGDLVGCPVNNKQNWNEDW